MKKHFSALVIITSIQKLKGTALLSIACENKMQVKKKNSARWIAKYRQSKHNTKFLSLCLLNILKLKTSALTPD